MELLNRIFYAAVLDSDCVEPGMDLHRLYQRTEETQRSQSHFRQTLAHAGLSQEQALPLWNVWSSSCLSHEHQGFLNGFRLDMMLSKELAEPNELETL